MTLALACFWGCAAVAVVAALAMVVARSPLASALALVVTLGALSGVLALLHAQLLAVVQILIYAGAIAVLVLFVLMVVDLDEAQLRRESPQPATLVGAGCVAAALGLAIWRVMMALAPVPAVAVPAELGSAHAAGQALLGTATPEGFVTAPLLYPFEVVSLLLLVAVAGAVVLSKRRIA